jgi:hypothetical protein
MAIIRVKSSSLRNSREPAETESDKVSAILGTLITDKGIAIDSSLDKLFSCQLWLQSKIHAARFSTALLPEAGKKSIAMVSAVCARNANSRNTRFVTLTRMVAAI